MTSEEAETNDTTYLDEDERKLIAIAQRLTRREKHGMMSETYRFERRGGRN